MEEANEGRLMIRIKVSWYTFLLISAHTFLLIPAHPC